MSIASKNCLKSGISSIGQAFPNCGLEWCCQPTTMINHQP
jgi:hypothetical protein